MQHEFIMYLYIPRRYRELDKISNLAHFVLMPTNRHAADEPCWPIISMAQNFEMKWLIDKLGDKKTFVTLCKTHISGLIMVVIKLFEDILTHSAERTE